MDSVRAVFNQYGQIYARIQGIKSGGKIISAKSNALPFSCEIMLRAIKYGKDYTFIHILT